MRLSRTVFLVCSAMAVAQICTGPAMAERNWLRDFFRGELGNRRKAEPKPVEPARTNVVRVPVKKISAPSYYSYRAEALQKVDFSAVIESPAHYPVGLSMASGASFAMAKASLAGFELMAEKNIAEAMTSHYAKTQEFVWVNGFAPSAGAKDVAAFLANAGKEGLEPADYAVDLPPDHFELAELGARLEALVRFEMTMTARVLRYVRDVESGRVDPNKLSGYHDLPVAPFNGKALLSRMTSLPDPVTWLAAKGPKGAHADALKRELAAIRASAEAEIIVDPDLLLKPGQSSPEFLKLMQIIRRDASDTLKAEFGALIETAQGSETYGEELVPLIKAAQKEKGLKPDGVIGPRTVGSLSPASKADRMEKVIMALERLRWLPDKLGPRRVFINQPEFVARYFSDDAEKLAMRVVVGKPSNQTSFFYDEIEQVDFNPYWGVPQSIIVNEMLPRLVRDPGYLDRAGYEVTDAKGRRVSSASINWGAHGGRVPYNVRQTPGERNALGELKILFPNKHAIYMHDTPSKSLFERDSRAFSHGCIRLHKPRDMAAAVLGTSVKDVATELARGHSSRKVPQKIPVYVAYFTAWPGADGTVGYFADVYGRDAHLEKALEAVAQSRQ